MMPKTPNKRPGLTRARVVQAAAEIVNTEGAGALSINRLARELQVQPPSLYNHIASLEAVWRELALLNLRGLGEKITQAALGRAGADGMMVVAQAYRSYVKENPGLYQASLRASGNMAQPDLDVKSAEERVLHVTVALIEPFGLEGSDAIHAVRAFRSAIHGFATLEAAGGFGLPVDLDESFRRLVEMIIHGIQSHARS